MWPNPQFPADLVTFTEEILNGKLYSLCSDGYHDKRNYVFINELSHSHLPEIGLFITVATSSA